jgi:hypothetical protein
MILPVVILPRDRAILDLPRRNYGQQKHGLRVPNGIRNRNRNPPGN